MFSGHWQDTVVPYVFVIENLNNIFSGTFSYAQYKKCLNIIDPVGNFEWNCLVILYSPYAGMKNWMDLLFENNYNTSAIHSPSISK